jgi:CheY-like chemotaxis protein
MRKPILLATDNSSDVYSFWLYHKQCGISNPVEVLGDGRDVISYLQAGLVHYALPALLVANLRMPEMGALQLLQYLAENQPREFSTVLLIDHKDHDLPLVTAAFRLRVDSFLRRPILKADFCQVMSRFATLSMDGCSDVGISSEPKHVLKDF